MVTRPLRALCSTISDNGSNRLGSETDHGER
jgi:hypothetical protein